MGESGEEIGRAEIMVGGIQTPANLARHSAEIGDVIARRSLVRQVSLTLTASSDLCSRRWVASERRANGCTRLAPSIRPLNTYFAELRRGAALSAGGELEYQSPDSSDDDSPADSAAGFLLSIRLRAYRRDVEKLHHTRERLLKLPEDEFAVRGIVVTFVGAMLGKVPLEEALLPFRFTGDLEGQSARRVCFGSQMRAELAGWFDRVDELVNAVELAESYGFVDLLWLDGCQLLDCARDDARFLAVRQKVVTRCHDAYDALWSPSGPE